MNRVALIVSHSSEDREAHAWSAFASAATDDAFCRTWLALQCAEIPDVRAGLLLLHEPSGEAFIPAAAWPDERRDLGYLSAAAERALKERRGTVLGLEPAEREQVAPGRVHVAYPVEGDAGVQGAVVLDLDARPEPQLQAVLRQLLWGAGWLEAMLRRRAAGDQSKLLERAATSLDYLQVAQQHRRLEAAAIAVVNEIATRCGAERVSLGIEEAGNLRLRAISRTAWFDRRSRLVESIESAMEECIDQEAAIVLPPVQGTPARVQIALGELAAQANSPAALSVPLLSRGRPIGALVIERSAALDAHTRLSCEMAGELLGPVFEALAERERWFSGRIADVASSWRDKLLGPRHPTVKLATLLILAVVLYLGLADGEFRVSARTSIEGSVQRAVVAPFEGYIAEANARAGDRVSSGQLLARLEDRDVELERVRWASEREQSELKYREALGKHDRVASRILAAQRERAQAQLSLAEDKQARTRLVAPFDGIVVSGDLSQLLGSPVEQGKVLFELAPLGTYRVILKVDERDIAHVAPGQRGELSLTGVSSLTLPFKVSAVTSVSSPEEGRNVFRVEADLENAPPMLRPGMEGVGKIAAGERRLIWIWTRPFIDWARITFWSWMP
jgi:hypothetical protein